MIDLEKILEIEAQASRGPWNFDSDTGLCGYYYFPKCKHGREPEAINADLINIMRSNIRQICLELQAAREYFSKDSEVRHLSLKDGLQAASNAWQEREDLLQKYHEVANGS